MKHRSGFSSTHLRNWSVSQGNLSNFFLSSFWHFHSTSTVEQFLCSGVGGGAGGSLAPLLLPLLVMIICQYEFWTEPVCNFLCLPVQTSVVNSRGLRIAYSPTSEVAEHFLCNAFFALLSPFPTSEGLQVCCTFSLPTGIQRQIGLGEKCLNSTGTRLVTRVRLQEMFIFSELFLFPRLSWILSSLPLLYL